MRKALAIITLLAGCAEHGSSPGGPGDGAEPPPTCAVGDADKITFTQDQGCGNDGSVEFCIPDNDAVLMTQLTVISTSITCAAGGGRAGCLQAPGTAAVQLPDGVPGAMHQLARRHDRRGVERHVRALEPSADHPDRSDDLRVTARRWRRLA